jgi:hypothetical protein
MEFANMKTPERIQKAREAVALILASPKPNPEHRRVLQGMLSAFQWCLDDGGSAVDSLLKEPTIHIITPPIIDAK